MIVTLECKNIGEVQQSIIVQGEYLQIRSDICSNIVQ